MQLLERNKLKKEEIQSINIRSLLLEETVCIWKGKRLQKRPVPSVQWVGKGRRITWLPHSPDLTSRYAKDAVCVLPLGISFPELA